MTLIGIASYWLLPTVALADTPTYSQMRHALVADCAGLAHVRITSVRCVDFGADEPTEATCRYTIRRKDRRLHDKTYFAIDAKGWHLIDTPGYCPAISRK